MNKSLQAYSSEANRAFAFSSDSQIESVYAWGLAASLILLVFSIKKMTKVIKNLSNFFTFSFFSIVFY